jgi:hypothetical protein
MGPLLKGAYSFTSCSSTQADMDGPFEEGP